MGWLGLALLGAVVGCSGHSDGQDTAEPRETELRLWKPRPPKPPPTAGRVPAQRIFVTSRKTTSNLGGIRGADRFCQQSADRAGLDGRWVALVSHSLIDASDRFSVRTPLVNLRPRRPRVVARSSDDLFDGRLRGRIAWDEHGRRVPFGSPVWTATRRDGTRVSSNPRHTAGDWSSDQGTRIGRVGFRDARWLSARSKRTKRARLYCVERRRPIEATVQPARVSREGRFLRATIEVAEVPLGADGAPLRRVPIDYRFVVRDDRPPEDPRRNAIDFGSSVGPTGVRVLVGRVVATGPGVYPVEAFFDGLDSSGTPMGPDLDIGIGGTSPGPAGNFDDFQIPPTPIDTAFTCVVAGRESAPDIFPNGRSDNTDDINIYGTDLGFHMQHGGESYLLFGDTWVDQVPDEQAGGAGYDGIGDDAFGTYPPVVPDELVPSLCDSLDWSRQPSDDYEPMSLTIENGATFFLGPFATPFDGFSIGNQGFGVFAPPPGDFESGPRLTRFDGDRTFALITVPNGTIGGQQHPLVWPTASATGQAEDWDWRDEDGEEGTGAAFIWGRTGNAFGILSRPTLAGYPAEYLAGLPTDANAGETTYYFTGSGQSWSTDPADAVEIYSDGLDPYRSSHYSVAWVEPLGRWVMLYGGHMFMTEADFQLEESGDVETGVYARQAPTPWGPWSQPRRVWHPLDQDNGVDGYCSLLWHPERANADSQCVQADVGRDAGGAVTRQEAIENSTYTPILGDFGQEYGVSIVEDLSLDVTGNGATRARIYWVMSTWNPYRVVLMRTDLGVF